MDSMLNVVTTIATIICIAAVLYSLTTALRKRHRKAKYEKDLVTKVHVKVDNLHQYDLKPEKGYYKYPLAEKGKLRRFPQHFTSVAIELANEQPYSICLLALAEFEKGELKDTRYFYIRPPENNLSAVKDHFRWEDLSKADEFGEYWQAGLEKLIEGKNLVAHNAPFVMGCLTHALHIYGIKAPSFRYADTMEAAKKLYNFSSNKAEAICEEMSLKVDPGNLLSQAIAMGRFFLEAKKDYPLYLPSLTYVEKEPDADDRKAAYIAAVEREEGTPEEMAAPETPDLSLIKDLADTGCLTAGKKAGTYYATDKGLSLLEQAD
ncbi:exonuclease domain-containing protein [uncultured Megasphaera sp.]|uniref:exonuclease domain-containing protein n=1 Tax=uncultured Megasphaera sp. TaxID=165188 RepID=UPI0025F7F6E7|nr:exonuclease domain-containing protein [uncultured Megasphaera sp.]